MYSETVFQEIINAWHAMSGWEMLAFVLALAYLLLAMKERVECWYMALGSTSIYAVIFWDVELLLMSVLQIYYLMMAIYGWSQWGKPSDNKPILSIHRWSWRRHSLVISSGLLAMLAVAYLLQINTSAEPSTLLYVEALTTCGAVVATFMVARKVLENWLYWIVIDALTVYLCVKTGLYLSGILFAVYVVLATLGFFQWQRRYQKQILL